MNALPAQQWTTMWVNGTLFKAAKHVALRACTLHSVRRDVGRGVHGVRSLGQGLLCAGFSQVASAPR
jgi:hypothetical protein